MIHSLQVSTSDSGPDPLGDAARESLRHSESRYRRLFETAQDGILILNADTAQIDDANPYLVNMLGYSHSDLLGKKLWEVGAFLDIAESKENFFALQKAGYIRYDNLPLRTINGDIIEVEFVSNCYVCDGVQVIQCDIRDITNHKVAERALISAEAKFRGLVEQVIAGIFIIQDGVVVYVNSRGAEIVGHGTADELIGTDLFRWVSEADRDHVSESMRQLTDGVTMSIAFSFAALRLDGATVEVCANAAYATHNGHPAVIGMFIDISEKRRAAREIQRYIAQLKTALASTVEVATIISEMRDPYTAGHERRVAEIAVAIGGELGLDSGRLEGLQVAGHLHDIGKMTVPAEILTRPGKLRVTEFQLIQEHAQAGYDVLKGVEFPWPVAQVALQHHERLDGTGYPLGIRGKAILLESRIIAVADVVEAMFSHRPYRAGLGLDKALAEIERGRGTAFDADVVDACLRLFREKGYRLPS